MTSKQGFQALNEEKETVPTGRDSSHADGQKQVFERGKISGVYDQQDHDPATEADASAVKNLRASNLEKVVALVDPGEEATDLLGSIMQEGDMTKEHNMKKDANPLTQLLKLQANYQSNKPSRIFWGKTRDKLKEYVQPDNFAGEAVFWKENVYTITQEFDKKANAKMVIKSTPILTMLDHSLKGDVVQENAAGKKVAKVDTFKMADAKLLGKLDFSSARIASQAFDIGRKKRDWQFIQNGKHLYVFVLTRNGAFGSGTTSASLVEVDLETGQTAPVSNFDFDEKDDKAVCTRVGFITRATKNNYPFPGSLAVDRTKFVAGLANELIVVTKHIITPGGSEAQLVADPKGLKMNVRALGSKGSYLLNLYEGSTNNKLDRVVSINSEDVIYLQEKAVHTGIAPDHAIEISEGILFLNEDAYGQSYYKIYQVARNESGAVTGCTLDEALECNPYKLDTFKLTVCGQNYKFLYDDVNASFFYKKSNPIESTALIIIDAVMNKIIQVGEKGDNYRTSMVHLKNHGTSFQKLSCLGMLGMSQYFPNFRGSHSTLSYALAYKFAELSLTKSPQVVISRKFSNMARTESEVFFWHKGDISQGKTYTDPDLKVDSLSLKYSEYFTDPLVRNRVQSARKDQPLSYIGQVGSETWSTSLQRRSLASLGQVQEYSFTRLHSVEGTMMLARVKGKHTGVIEHKSFFDKLMVQNDADYWEDRKREDQIELFKFSLSGSSPDDREEAVVKYDQDWRLYYERVRFEDDSRTQRPLLFGQIVRDDDGNFDHQKYWLALYDFKKEHIVRQVQINLPELVKVKYEIENVSIAACGEVKPNKNNANLFTQKFCIAFPLKHQLRVKIVEYTITWDYSDGQSPCPFVTLQQTATKEFVMRKPEGKMSNWTPTAGLEELKFTGKQKFQGVEVEHPVQMIPYLDSTNQIQGVQLVVGTGASAQVYVLEKKDEKSVQRLSKIPLVKNIGYKVYKDETNHSYTAVMAFCQLTKAMQVDKLLNDNERIEILEDSVRAVLNTVVFDPSIPVPEELKDRNFNETFLKQIDLGRGCEVIDWFSFASLMSNNDELQNTLDNCHRPYGYDPERFQQTSQLSFAGLIERVLLNEICTHGTYDNQTIQAAGQTIDYDRINSLQRDGCYIKGHEILQRDIFFNHPLHYLISIENGDNPKDNFVTSIIEFIFSPHNNCDDWVRQEAQKHLNALMVHIIERGEKQDCFFNNFVNQSAGHTLNACQKATYNGQPRTQGVELQGFALQQPEHMMRQELSVIVEKSMQGQKTVSGVDYPVECIFYDMRPYNFEQKVIFIKNNVNQDGKLNFDYYDSKKYKKKIGFSWSQYDQADLISSVLGKTEGEIHDQRLVRHICDDYYSKKTSGNAGRMLFAYTFFFFIPFFLQMYIHEFSFVITCNSLCMLMSLYLARFEVEQMKIQGSEYFESFMNWVDMAGFATYCTYFGLRITDPGMQMPNYKQDPIEDALTFLSFPLIMYTAIKLLFYFQMFEGFGLFMYLVQKTLEDMSVFLPFFFYWIFVFSCQMFSLGAGYKPDDYPELSDFTIIVLATWRNAIGDIYAPDYHKWSENLNAEDAVKDEESARTGVTYTYVMITLVWLIWWLNQLFLFLVLTNFLISIIGNSFGDNIEKNMEVAYANKIDLNVETALFKKWMGNDQKFDTLIFLCPAEDSSSGELDESEVLNRISTKMKTQQESMAALRSDLDGKVDANTEKMLKLNAMAESK